MQKPDNAAARLGQVVGGRWKLERVLGSGATATVYAARDSSGSSVALKLLHPDLAVLIAEHRVLPRFLTVIILSDRTAD